MTALWFFALSAQKQEKNDVCLKRLGILVLFHHFLSTSQFQHLKNCNFRALEK
jgi:hypothetical protein